MTATSNDIANEALVSAGWTEASVSGFAPTFDNSTVGLILQRIYQPVVNKMLRAFPWDCARKTGVALVASGNLAPSPWAFEYIYPASCIQLWQVMPAAIGDPNDPLPQFFNVGNAQVGGVMTKVIWTDFAGALATFNASPLESVWDAGLREAVVAALAQRLALALGKPETAQGLGDETMLAATMAQSRVD